MTPKPTYEELAKKVLKLERKEFVHKQVAGLLRDSKEKLRVILETVSSGVEEIDLNGVITAANSSYERLTGYDKDELTGMHIWELIAPGPEKDSLSEYIKYLIKEQPEPTVYFAKYLTKDGREIDVQVDWNYKRDENGKLAGFVSVISDITERRLAEQEQTELNEELNAANEELNAINEELNATLDNLRDSEGKVRTLTESSLDAIVMTDHEARISYWNKAAENIFGFTKEEVLGEFVYEPLAPPRLKEAYKELHHQAVEMGYHPAAGKTTEFPVLKKGGEEFTMEASFSIFKYKGKWNTVSFVRDITERKLIEEEHKKNYLNLVSVMIVAINIDGTVDFINDTGCELLGYERDEIVGKNWIDNYLPEKYKAEVTPLFNEVMADRTKVIKQYESPILNSDGEERIILWNNVLLTDDKGNITGILSTDEDITDKKLAEEAQKESETKYQELFNTAIDGLFVFELIDGIPIYTDCNPKALSMFRCTREEIIGKSLIDFSPTLQPDGISSEEKARQNISLLMEDEPPHFEWRHLRTDNTLLDVEVSVSISDNKYIIAIISDNKYIIAIVRDITQKKMAEKALKESETSLKDAQRIAHVGSWCFDISTRTYTASDEAFRIFGFEPQSITADYEFKTEHIHPDDREYVLKSFNDAINNNKPYNLEYRILLDDGTEKYLTVNGMLYHNADGTPKCLAGTMQDITERKLAEEERGALGSNYCNHKKWSPLEG
jgi:PAS domain S-box-containing protein